MLLLDLRQPNQFMWSGGRIFSGKSFVSEYMKYVSNIHKHFNKWELNLQNITELMIWTYDRAIELKAKYLTVLLLYIQSIVSDTKEFKTF